MLDVTQQSSTFEQLSKTTHVMVIESLHIQLWYKKSEPQHSSQLPTTCRESQAYHPENFELWMHSI